MPDDRTPGERTPWRYKPRTIMAVRFEPGDGDATFVGLKVHRDASGPYLMVKVGRDFATVAEGEWMVTDPLHGTLVLSDENFRRQYEPAD